MCQGEEERFAISHTFSVLVKPGQRGKAPKQVSLVTLHNDECIRLPAGELQTGDIVINTGSMPLHKRFRTNMLKITVIE